MQILRRSNGQTELLATAYHLIFPSDRPFVYLDLPGGERLVELFFLSSIHSANGQDDTPWIGSWEAAEGEDEIVFSLEAGSSIWDGKTYQFYCQPDRLRYDIKIQGKGDLTEVCYFGGYASHQVRWGSGFFWSGQTFERGFNPEPNSDEESHFAPNEATQIDLMGVPLPGKGDWFFTPAPFCYGFQRGQNWMGIGVETQPGSYRFTEYRYHGRRGAFHLSLSYEGHTSVDGEYSLPGLGFEFGKSEQEVLEKHVWQVHRALGQIAGSKQQVVDWWQEPIFCGWGAQCSLAAIQGGFAPNYSRQEMYQDFLCTLEEHGITPGIVVLDDKWQLTYGDIRVDPQKWPNLKAFIWDQHRKGRKVLLWLKAWDPEGIPANECITNAAGLPIAVDPSNPIYEKRFRKSIRYLLSSAGMDADGFKIDFTARIPSGPGIKTAGNLWGLELMRCYLKIIHSEAKTVKSDALIMTHTPHPYLADIVDMIRLNDINKDEDINRAMRLRADIVRIACPNAIIDTDNWPLPSKSAFLSYLPLQLELGVPSLYFSGCIDSTQEALNSDDYRLIQAIWSEHRSRHLPVG